jgi:DNA-directed RNA polymerase subunit RPC12/RpoP
MITYSIARRCGYPLHELYQNHEQVVCPSCSNKPLFDEVKAPLLVRTSILESLAYALGYWLAVLFGGKEAENE